MIGSNCINGMAAGVNGMAAGVNRRYLWGTFAISDVARRLDLVAWLWNIMNCTIVNYNP